MLWTERLGLSMDEGVGFIAEKGQGQFKTAVALTSGDSVVISALTTLGLYLSARKNNAQPSRLAGAASRDARYSAR